MKIWSAVKVVHSKLECKFWSLKTPSVEEVRPGRCPACAAAAREPGRPIGIVGHGVRERQLRGPIAVDAVPTVEILCVRRYRCRRCCAVITVVPREVEPRRHYSRPAIAMALALLGLLARTSSEIREAVSPWRTAATTSWRALSRWIGAVRRGALFPSASPSEKASDIEIAERVAQVAMSHAPPTMRGAPALALVFRGAVAMT